MEQMIIATVLIENTSDSSLACEHGLSILIEFEGKRILLDAGSSEAFCANADAMALSLEGLDACVLSHGHYDHSGGFGAVFRRDPEAKVYARKEALDVYLSGAGGMHEISVPRQVSSCRDRFIPVDGFREIFSRVFLVPHHTAGLDAIGEKCRLYKRAEGRIVPDDFVHEQSLVFSTEKGLIIFNSCSHGGVASIIREAREACGGKPVYAYIGGMHMKGKKDGREICTFSEAEVDALCETIRQEGIEWVYTGHCTGDIGFQLLKDRLGEIVQRLTTGFVIEM